MVPAALGAPAVLAAHLPVELVALPRPVNSPAARLPVDSVDLADQVALVDLVHRPNL